MNALLKINSRRAKRMSEEEALEALGRLGFVKGERIRHTVHREGRGRNARQVAETIVTVYHRNSTYADGSPRYDRAVLTARFSI